ncbi:CRISPR-associated endoribonuclease Cas6 [Chitinophaga qingshengii]|uniref:CRISPR-associated endoribonuclease Cas6 n=1 Tax=Chitinophaga qingshengii TaxID=1569794 RepID=A0ABR7TK58_9BACT|nr:CRISPR-associated endoribonuclease Cas6 [Chitinophaga qingshengii]MBC9929877.1 CRISPR-associated endoribonuclease Cas6 [Chitinophaga qingshengii]
MQLKITLNALQPGSIIPINYQYPLSAAIYRILSRGDAGYATFLHDIGYRRADSLKTFKLFTCSDIQVPFRIYEDRLVLLSQEATFIFSFYLPKTAFTFMKGLFMHQHMEIADHKSKTTFKVIAVEALPDIPVPNDAQLHDILLQPISPIVSGYKDTNGHYTFLSPENSMFIDALMFNWSEKYKTVYEESNTTENSLSVVMCDKPLKSRLISIKAGTKEQIRIKGYMNFLLKAKGDYKSLNLLVNGGVGLYNSVCMGSVLAQMS